MLAENAHLTYKYLTPYLYDFLEALITQQETNWTWAEVYEYLIFFQLEDSQGFLETSF